MCVSQGRALLACKTAANAARPCGLGKCMWKAYACVCMCVCVCAWACVSQGAELDRSSVCYDTSASLIIQVTDICPCEYPPNAYSNKRWCCGDMPHLDLSTFAFEKLADTDLGVIGIEYRFVSKPCLPCRLCSPCISSHALLAFHAHTHTHVTPLHDRVYTRTWRRFVPPASIMPSIPSKASPLSAFGQEHAHVLVSAGALWCQAQQGRHSAQRPVSLSRPACPSWLH